MIISPPSTGKTALCEALGVNRRWTKTVGTFKGLHSGWQTDNEGEEDNSTIALLKDKTLIVKDADPLLKAPNRDQILADFRDAYDTNCAVQFKNKVKREYQGLRFTVLLCGTESLLELDSADLGARFLVCVIMDKINSDFESSINRRVFHRMIGSRGVEANGAVSTHDAPKMLRAKQMTGGYINWLRANASQMLAELDLESQQDELSDEMDMLAQFVAFMRARPSKKQEEASTREMSARLNAQLTKLSMCLAVVLNRRNVDDEVLRRVRKVALDTARGRTMELCRHLYAEGRVGAETKHLAHLTGHEEVKERVLLKFLRRIDAVEAFRPVSKKSGVAVKTGGVRWRLTPRLQALYGRVVEGIKTEVPVDA